MKTAEEIYKIAQNIAENANGSWIDMVTEGYEAGYKDAMEEYRNQSESAGVWVKASDRLPKQLSSNAKMNGSHGVLYNNGNYLEFVGKGFVNSYTLNSNNLSAIEYLDESTKPTIKP